VQFATMKEPNTVRSDENDISPTSSESARKMVRITGGGHDDWLDPSGLPNVDDLEIPPMARRQHKLLRFLPSKILQRRQALFRRLHPVKDFSWAVAAVLVIPSGLLFPPLHASQSDSLIHSSLTLWTLGVALFLAIIFALSLNRLLYKSRAGTLFFLLCNIVLDTNSTVICSTLSLNTSNDRGDSGSNRWRSSTTCCCSYIMDPSSTFHGDDTRGRGGPSTPCPHDSSHTFRLDLDLDPPSLYIDSNLHLYTKGLVLETEI
jgi:hypothetical protein